MSTSGLDHVNILTDNLEATVTFYEQVLGLEHRESPGTALGYKGAWLCDARGHPVIHLVWNDPAKDYGAGRQPGHSTNAVHHVAFLCHGFAETRQRLAALGIEHRVNDGMAGLKQIMVRDPNAITVEMNFTAEPA